MRPWVLYSVYGEGNRLTPMPVTKKYFNRGPSEPVPESGAVVHQAVVAKLKVYEKCLKRM